jgi:hypothetical protein
MVSRATTMLRRWMKYPFALAGPVSAALWSVLFLTGLVLAIAAVDRLSSVVIACGVVLPLSWLHKEARRHYARRRGIDVEAHGFWTRTIPNLIGVVGGLTGVVLAEYFGLHFGWSLVIGASVCFGLEVLLRFVLSGEIDPRWSVDYRVEPVQVADGAID